MKTKEKQDELLDGIEFRARRILCESPGYRDRGDTLLQAYLLTMGNRNSENGPPVEQMDSVAACGSSWSASATVT